MIDGVFLWSLCHIDEKELVHSGRFGGLLQKIRLNLPVNSLGHADARLYLLFCAENWRRYKGMTQIFSFVGLEVGSGK